MEEDDKRILEIFRIINKDNLKLEPSTESAENCNEECLLSISSQEALSSTHCKLLPKKKLIKKPIFRILKTNQNHNFDSYKYKTQLEQITSYNNEVLIDMLYEDDLERNLQNIHNFIQINNAYNVNNFMNMELKTFQETMKIFLNKWNLLNIQK